MPRRALQGYATVRKCRRPLASETATTQGQDREARTVVSKQSRWLLCLERARERRQGLAAAVEEGVSHAAATSSVCP
jgi:hypothetical protein